MCVCGWVSFRWRWMYTACGMTWISTGRMPSKITTLQRCVTPVNHTPWYPWSSLVHPTVKGWPAKCGRSHSLWLPKLLCHKKPYSFCCGRSHLQCNKLNYPGMAMLRRGPMPRDEDVWAALSYTSPYNWHGSKHGSEEATWVSAQSSYQMTPASTVSNWITQAKTFQLSPVNPQNLEGDMKLFLSQ